MKRYTVQLFGIARRVDSLDENCGYRASLYAQSCLYVLRTSLPRHLDYVSQKERESRERDRCLRDRAHFLDRVNSMRIYCQIKRYCPTSLSRSFSTLVTNAHLDEELEQQRRRLLRNCSGWEQAIPLNSPHEATQKTDADEIIKRIQAA